MKPRRSQGGQADLLRARFSAVSEADEKQTLRRYLQETREALLWKLEGLSDYDIRRPMTPTGTNLLALVKHCAAGEFVYFGRLPGRPFPGEAELDWHEGDETELSGHMYATATASRQQVTDFYRRTWAHSDAMIEELPLDAHVGVPWWPPDAPADRLDLPVMGDPRLRNDYYEPAAGDGIRSTCSAPARGCL
jgi:Protein of unknown function (DUF664)